MPIFLNWIWQGSALTLVVALVVCRLRAVNAATRERIWWATLASVCLMPLVAVLVPVSPAGAAGATAAGPLVFVAQPSNAAWTLAGLAWGVWVVVSAVRLTAAMVALVQAKRSASPFPAARLKGLQAWARVSSNGREATLGVTERVATAAVLGIGRPMIAVSPHLLERLNDDELDNILVHEHAHVQRRDDLGVLAQRTVSTVFGWHPAIWWLGRALSLEREVACDDLVLTQKRTSPQRYARSLVRLVEQTTPRPGLLAPGAIFTRPQLTRRVVRLLDRTRNASARVSRPAIGLASAAIAFGVVAMLPVQLIAVAAPALASRLVAAGLVQPLGSLTGVAPESRAAGSSGTQTTGSTRRFLLQSQQSASPAGETPVAAAPPEADAGVSPDQVTSGLPQPSPVALNPSGPGGAEAAVQVPPVTMVSDTFTPQRAAVPAEAPTPWGQATDAASAVGKVSRTGAVKTAGFFTRMGKSIAGAF